MNACESGTPIVELETIRPAFQPNVTLLRLRSADGQVGLGEAFFAAGAVEAYLHEQIAPVLLGLADPTPERVSSLLAPYVGFQGGGVEPRAVGAVDLALWDVLGWRAGLPVVDLLGGAVRERVPVYNTCAGPGYVGWSSRQHSTNWGLDDSSVDDLRAFLEQPAALAHQLAAEGLGGMKVWPFDTAAERTGGTAITPGDLGRGLSVVQASRGRARDAADDRTARTNSPKASPTPDATSPGPMTPQVPAGRSGNSPTVGGG